MSVRFPPRPPVLPIAVDPREEERAAALPPGTPKPFKPSPGRGYVRLAPTESMKAAIADSAGPVPHDFGVPSGTRIANYDTILPDLWKAFGRDKPPAFAWIISEGLSNVGHAVCAYPVDGTMTAMNIVGRKGQSLVNFMPLEELLFGVDEMDHNEAGTRKLYTKADGSLWKNTEGGAYHRDYTMVVVWEWPAEKIEAMHRYFEDLAERHANHQARFEVWPFPLMVAAVSAMKGDAREAGNCAMWTSRGAAMADLVPKASGLPKDPAIEILRTEGRTNPDNVDIISVPWIENARRTNMMDKPPGVRDVLDLTGLSAKFPPSYHFYKPHTHVISPRSLFGRTSNLATRAGARVVVDHESIVARVELQSRALSRL